MKINPPHKANNQFFSLEDNLHSRWISKDTWVSSYTFEIGNNVQASRLENSCGNVAIRRRRAKTSPDVATQNIVSWVADFSGRKSKQSEDWLALITSIRTSLSVKRHRGASKSLRAYILYREKLSFSHCLTFNPHTGERCLCFTRLILSKICVELLFEIGEF